MIRPKPKRLPERVPTLPRRPREPVESPLAGLQRFVQRHFNPPRETKCPTP
jgi:hypothetical protein